MSPILIFAILVIMLIAIIESRHRALGRKILLTHLLISIAGIFFYQLLFPNYLHLWFFTVLFPAVTILSAIGFTAVAKRVRYPSVFLIGIIIVINVLMTLTTDNQLSLGYKLAAVKFAQSKITSVDRVEIRSIGNCFGWSGYRYLFTWIGHTPVKSYLDNLFGDWLYPAELTATPPTQIITFIDHEPRPFPRETQQLYEAAKTDSVSGARFGAIEVFISPNIQE